MSYELVIFDVDGTLVCTRSGKEFRESADDWKLLPGRLEKTDELRREGVRLALASNQGGVAFGYMQEEDIVDELLKLADVLGVDQSAVYRCTSHPTASIERYRSDSSRRKPNPGMLKAAMLESGIGPAKTLMVGDRPEDEQAAKAAGCDFELAETYFGSASNEALK